MTGDQLDVLPVSLPGREKRYVEAAYRSVETAIAGANDEVVQSLTGYSQVAIFGHGMGAVLAFEMARRLSCRLSPKVVLVAVSGAPDLMSPRQDYARGLSDEQFLDQVASFEAYTPKALAQPQMRALLLQSLRADIELHERYVPLSAEALDVPVLAMRGTEDELVSSQQILQWCHSTRASFTSVEIPGDHMYLRERPGAVLQAIGTVLEQIDCEAGALFR